MVVERECTVFFFDAIVPAPATKFDYLNVLLLIDMNEPVIFTSSQYTQS